MLFVVDSLSQIHKFSMIIGQRTVLEAAYTFELWELWEVQTKGRRKLSEPPDLILLILSDDDDITMTFSQYYINNQL